MSNVNTGLFDENGMPIYAGDILLSKDGYSVTVCQSKDGKFYGSLNCELEHSCRNIPYSLNDGSGYFKMSVPAFAG